MCQTSIVRSNKTIVLLLLLLSTYLCSANNNDIFNYNKPLLPEQIALYNRLSGASYIPTPYKTLSLSQGNIEYQY